MLFKSLVILFFNLSFIFGEKGYISGTIVDENSNPLPGCNVYLEGTDIGIATNSNGFFKLNDLDEGKYELIAEFLGYEQNSYTFYISLFDENVNINSDDYLSKLGLNNELNSVEIEKRPFFIDVLISLKPEALNLNEIIISASRVKQKITESPSVVSLINEKTLRRRVGVSDYNRLASLAKGVDVTYFGSQGAQINARGFDGAYSTRFRQFCDGLYLGESVTGQVYSLLSGPPKEAISRIEVLFGPQSALYGPDASQGLLNVITKHPMQESKNEINFSISSLNDPRIGGRYVKNFEKLSIDISGESKFSNEIPYGNDDDDLYWIVDSDTLYYTEDLFSPMELAKNNIYSNIYYRLKNDNELSIFYNYTDGKGYAMGSLGPIYNKGLTNHQYGVRFNNKNHFFRITSNNQKAKNMMKENIAGYQIRQGDIEYGTIETVNGDSTFVISNEIIPWNEALEGIEDFDDRWWLTFDSRDLWVDYQYSNNYTENLKLVSGFDYEFKDPNTKRSAVDDVGISPITGEYGGTEINEYRYGIYSQIDYKLNNYYSINSSLRYDNHQYYGEIFSPRISLVRKNFLFGTLKLIAGTGFKAPTLLERNIHTGSNNIYSGVEGALDPFVEDYPELGTYPEDFVIHAIAMGSSNGFTVVDFKDLDGDGVYSVNDSLIDNKYFEPLKLEKRQSIEIAYTGIIDNKNLLEFNFFSARYKNFKGPLTTMAVTGPAWHFMSQAYGYLPIDAIRQVHTGEELISGNPIPPFIFALTYTTIPLDVTFYGFEGGWKHIQENYEISSNFSYFHDQNLVDKRKRGKNGEAEYLSYVNMYSNTPNFKGSLSITKFNTIMNSLTSTFNFKYTSPFDFSSGYFRATKEGKGEIPPQTIGQSWFRDPGQIGGQLYVDIDLNYKFNDHLNTSFSIKNLLQTGGPTMPLTPKIPRSFAIDFGYKF